MLTSFEVGQAGKQYIQQKLSAGVGWVPFPCVARAVSQSNVIPLGYSYATAEVTPDCDVNNFDASCGKGGQDAKKLLSKWIWNFISMNPIHACLIDEQQYVTNDLGWQKDIFPSFSDTVRFSNGSVLYCASISTITKEKVSELVESTFWYPFSCAFVVDDENAVDTVPENRELSEEKLVNIARHTHGFVTDAYDLEGLLFWARQQALDLDKPFW